MAAAARWTGKALVIAERLDSAPFLAHTLRMHGNALRKANHISATIKRLGRAVELSADREGQATALALLARACGEHGTQEMFDDAITRYRTLLDARHTQGMLFNPFTFHEVQLRGLMSTGRAAEAIRIIQTGPVDAAPAAPQWHVIERVTAGQVHIAAGDHDCAIYALRTALIGAETHRLPHQIQRAIRAAHSAGLTEIKIDAQAALLRLNRLLAPPDPEI